MHVCRYSFICVAWHFHLCDVTHSYVWHDSFICVTWLIHMCDMTHSCVTWLIWRDQPRHTFTWVTAEFVSAFLCHTCTCMSWLMSHMHMYDITHAWRDSCIPSLMWHMHSSWMSFHVTRDSSWRDSCITSLMWHMHMYDITHVTHTYVMSHVTHAHVWHDSCDTYTRVAWLMSHMHMYVVTHVTHAHVWHDSCDTYTYVTWLRNDVNHVTNASWLPFHVRECLFT